MDSSHGAWSIFSGARTRLPFIPRVRVETPKDMCSIVFIESNHYLFRWSTEEQVKGPCCCATAEQG